MGAPADEVAEKYLEKVKIKDEFISATCPFHGGGQEKHPSFWVSRDSGNWGCFSCPASGSNLKELLKELGVSNRRLEAEIEELQKEERANYKLKKLKEQNKAQAEFTGKYILPEEVLGVFDYDPGELIEAGFDPGILQDHNIGYDKRNDRITFPLRDYVGNLVGISGRSTIPGESPKYLVYRGKYIDYAGKQRDGELGGWYPGYSNQGVRDHLWRADRVYPEAFADKDSQIILVEGYKAALWLVQHGWDNVMALTGNRISRAQERLVRRIGAETFVFLDNNKPGKDGSKKVSQKLAISTFPVYTVGYPDGFDEHAQPDSLNVTELEEALSTATRAGGSNGRRKFRI